MNGIQIATILERDPYTTNSFGGVYAKDLFASIKSLKNKLFVVNTDNSNYPGSHWVAFNFSSASCEFFDSYGQSPIIYGLHKIFQRYKVTYSNKPIQGFNSSVCGQYCILFLLLRSRGYSYSNIISWFTNDNTNEEFDHIVNEAILFYLEHIAGLKMKLVVHDKQFLQRFFVTNPYCVYNNEAIN